MRSGVELIWLEDFLALVATRNFSTAASARNISQSAFSRRIRALEDWLGAELIDRSSSPVRMTNAGSLFLSGAQDLVRSMYRLQVDCRNVARAHDAPVTFAALHTLAIYFFPAWLDRLGPELAPGSSTMHADDFLECLEQLSAGRCDFVLAFDHPSGPPVLGAGPYESLKIGEDCLVLACGTDAHGQPLFDIEDNGTPLPYLAYTWNDGYIGRLIGMILSRREKPLNLVTVYQSALAEGLKHMALAGRGVAWLPRISIRDAVAEGRLVELGGKQMALDTEVRLFRKHGYRTPEAEKLWAHLRQHGAALANSRSIDSLN